MTRPILTLKKRPKITQTPPPAPLQATAKAVKAKKSPDKQEVIAPALTYWQKYRLKKALFREFWPEMFDNYAPIQVGAFEALTQDALARSLPVTKTVIRRFLKVYTAEAAYHQKMLTSKHRVDVRGNPAGEITESDREKARREIEVRQARWEAQRSAASS